MRKKLLLVLVLILIVGCRDFETVIEQYEVISVNKFKKTKTNNMGGIISEDIYYHFNFIGSDGTLQERDITHLEYGLTKVEIGEKDAYIVEKSIDTIKRLIISEETLKNMGKI